jgi:hypothetical protein
MTLATGTTSSTTADRAAQVAESLHSDTGERLKIASFFKQNGGAVEPGRSSVNFSRLPT